MHHALQVELTEAIFRHLDAGTTDTTATVSRNPVDSYTSKRRLHQELDALFRKRALFMGLSCQLPAPGDFITEERGSAPLLMVRGEDGKVRAFMNVCRHRGARVAPACGTGAKRFVCPYHGWTYDTAGALIGIPDARSFPGVEKSAHPLVRVPALERDGMLWAVAGAPGPEDTSPARFEIDLANYLEGLAPELASYGLARYHHYESRVITQPLNWKLVIDTFLEPYHFAVLHRDTVAPIFFPNLCLFHPFGPHLRETLPRQSIEGLRTTPREGWDLVKHTALVYLLFPNTVFVVQADHVETWRVYPTADKPDESTVTLDFFIPEPVTSDAARRHWERNMDLTVRTVLEEDFPTSAGMQTGFLSGAQTHVVYGRNEPALAHFEQQVAAAVASTAG